MSLIVVDPPRLRDAARALKELAVNLRRLAREVLRTTDGAPSYDGEFGPRVRSGGAEVYAEHESVARLAEEAAEFLLEKADQFESADQSGQAALASLGMQLSQWSQAFEALLGAPASEPDKSQESAIEDFEGMTEDERIAWLRAFHKQPGSS
jgi:hypothetical protein